MNEQPKKPETSIHVLQICKIGNSTGVILPKELLLKLGLKEGDKLSVVEQPERGRKLTPYDLLHEKAMEAARKSFRTYANSYRALAK